jgi:hypothetical protein
VTPLRAVSLALVPLAERRRSPWIRLVLRERTSLLYIGGGRSRLCPATDLHEQIESQLHVRRGQRIESSVIISFTQGSAARLPPMVAIGVLGALVGLALGILLPRLWGTAREHVPRLLGVIKLTWLRAAGGAVFGLSITTAIGLNYNGHGHKPMTYAL